VSEYPKELPPFPPLFNYPLFAPPIEIGGELIYNARHCAAFFLYQAYLRETKAIKITIKLITEANSNIDAIQLFNRCEEGDRAAILQAIALMSLALEYRFESAGSAEYN
jgi:hypothetical protein